MGGNCGPKDIRGKVNTSLVSKATRTYAANSTHEHTEYKQVGLYSEVQHALSFYRVTCERKRPITVVTKGGRGSVFHCAEDLMDCTITTAHRSMNNPTQVRSTATQTKPVM